MKLLKGVLLLATVATVVSGSKMMQSFKRYRDKKANQHRLPDGAKGVICEKSGREPTNTCCYNKHGVRCSSDFQRETDTCPGAGCQYTKGYTRCPGNLPQGATCREHRGKNFYTHVITHSCKTNRDMQESLCPQPCGCVLDGQPKRESSGTMKTHKINGECGSASVLKAMKQKLSSWKVPKETVNQYEMAALFDEAEFAVFDLFIQPKENEARYKLALGAARCHKKHVEIGFMDTGMWKVDTLNNYKCHWKGGCSNVGIPPESIEKARIVLEHYAWKNLRVGRRRLSEDGDSVDDLFVHTVEIPDNTKEGGGGLRRTDAFMDMGMDESGYDERTLEERVVEDDVRKEMKRQEEWRDADTRTLEERVAEEEDALGFDFDRPAHTQPHMPTGESIGNWISFRL